jgi:hypothetical protein
MQELFPILELSRLMGVPLEQPLEPVILEMVGPVVQDLLLPQLK